MSMLSGLSNQAWERSFLRPPSSVVLDMFHPLRRFGAIPAPTRGPALRPNRTDIMPLRAHVNQARPFFAEPCADLDIGGTVGHESRELGGTETDRSYAHRHHRGGHHRLGSRSQAA